MMSLLIHPRFQALIPPLTFEELAQLEDNLRRDGCRDPLVVWDNVILDGHNRYEICTRLGLEFQTVSMNFASHDAAADWIDANQLGRRNLTPDAAALLRGRRYNRIKRAEGRPKLDQNDLVISGATAARLAGEHGVSAPTIKRDGRFAAAVEVLKQYIPDIEQRVMVGDIPSRSLVVDASLNLYRCEVCGNTWMADLDACPYCTMTPAGRIANLNRESLSKPHVWNNAGNNEWYTPPEYIEGARQAMGGIDLDPASSAIANQTVQATTFYTAADDGLSKPWSGRVWLNPPYAQPLVAQFVDAISDRYDAGEITAACVLVNNATETAWCQRLMDSMSAMLLIKGRIKFLDEKGDPSGAPLQGQILFYLGKDVAAFCQAYPAKRFGAFLFPWGDAE